MRCDDTILNMQFKKDRGKAFRIHLLMRDEILICSGKRSVFRCEMASDSMQIARTLLVAVTEMAIEKTKNPANRGLPDFKTEPGTLYPARSFFTLSCNWALAESSRPTPVQTILLFPWA